MKKFPNLHLVKTVLNFIVYGCLLGLLISDIITYNDSHTEMINQHYLNWWTLFLVLDMWFFGDNQYRKNQDTE
jgi:hypothetical protein